MHTKLEPILSKAVLTTPGRTQCMNDTGKAPFGRPSRGRPDNPNSTPSAASVQAQNKLSVVRPGYAPRATLDAEELDKRETCGLLEEEVKTAEG